MCDEPNKRRGQGERRHAGIVQRRHTCPAPTDHGTMSRLAARSKRACAQLHRQYRYYFRRRHSQLVPRQRRRRQNTNFAAYITPGSCEALLSARHSYNGWQRVDFIEIGSHLRHRKCKLLQTSHISHLLMDQTAEGPGD